MLHLFSDPKPWFEAKRFGYGAGLPIAWQGWVLLASYVAALVGLALLAGGARGMELVGVVAGMVALTVVLVVVARKRTRGAWRWRSGDDG